MPMFKWPKPPMQIVQAYESRRSGRGDIGALVLWATWTVEGLHYLDDIDRLHHEECSPPKEHLPEIVNIAHVRWATGSAITALDLCAAVMGRECCEWTGTRELDLRDFDPSLTNKGIPARRARLSATSIEWVDGVLADPCYKEVQGARNPLTHSRLRRKIYIGGPSQTKFVITATGNAVGTRDLVGRARDLATKKVVEFLNVLATFP